MNTELIKRRLNIEHKLIKETCENSDVINYEIIQVFGKRNDITVNEMLNSKDFPPTAYLVEYEIRGVVGIDNHNMPLYGNFHQAKIEIPENCQMQFSQVTMLTDLWHPNVKYYGHFKGRVCLNMGAIGIWCSISDVVIRLGQMIQYKVYSTFGPEEYKVAEWVKEFAEPNNIINYQKKICVDDTILVKEKKNKDNNMPDFRVKMESLESVFKPKTKEIRSLVQQCIASNNTEDAIEHLTIFFKEEALLSKLQSVIIHSSNFTRIKNERTMNLISFEDYNIKMSQINNALLECINEI